MSLWFLAKEDNIDIEYSSREVDIYLGQDHNGSLYVTLTFDQIKEINEKIAAKEDSI